MGRLMRAAGLCARSRRRFVPRTTQSRHDGPPIAPTRLAERTAICFHSYSLEASMSRTGNPYDNAAMESFFSTLKTECLHRRAPTTRRETQAQVFDYLETFYNRKRFHSSLGYLSPQAFLDSYIENLKPSLNQLNKSLRSTRPIFRGRTTPS